MNPAFIFGIVLMLTAGTALSVVLTGNIKTRRNERIRSLTKENDRLRAVIDEQRELIYEVDELAFGSREIEPNLAVQIIDTIRQHRKAIEA